MRKPSNKTWMLVGIIIIALIAINAYSFFSKQTPPAPTETATTTPSVVEITFASSTKTIQTKEYAVQFDFPVTNVEHINTDISAFVDATVDAFVDEVKSFGPLPVADRQYTMYGWFEPHTDSSYTTFVFLVAVDTGGAHPNQFFYTKTYTQSGTLLSIEDALRDVYGQPITLDTVSKTAYDILMDQLGEKAVFGWLEDGLQPKPESFADFYVDNNDVVLLFEPYTIGPYAWGATTVRLSREALGLASDAPATTTASSTESTATTTSTVQ